MNLLAVVIDLCLIGLLFLLYWIPRRLGYPKLGWLLSSLFGLLLVASFLFLMKDRFFSKEEASTKLQEQGIVLKSDFEILKNRSEYFPDFYHTFHLQLSLEDHVRLIEEIRSSADFKPFGKQVPDIRALSAINPGERIVLNYELTDFWVRELLQSAQPGFAPLHIQIKIHKREALLIYEHFDR